MRQIFNIIHYIYSASGQKLRVVSKWNSTYNKAPILGSVINTSLLTTSKTTDYVANKIYENGVLKRILIDGGYIEASKYHYYQTDHLGNNRVVADNTGAIVQSTHYYPSGMAFAEGTGEGKQPYKYNGKELDAQHGLNTYDYAARYMDPGIGRFSSVDPLAEKYYSWSPCTYVGNNPMKYIDPDGKKVRLYNYTHYGKSGQLSGVKGLSQTTNAAVSAYMKTAEGYNTIARYASKGDEIGGHSFIQDGELSNHTLDIRDISLSEEQGQIVPSGRNGDISLDGKADGLSVIRIWSLGQSEADVVETLSHELNAHGENHKNLLQGKKIPSVDADHKALRDKNTKHKGYNSYSKVREGLKDKDPKYEKAFKSKEEEYKRKYEEL